MRKPLTPTQLRADLFNILDEVLDTGEPCEIVRGNRRLVIMPAGKKRRNLDLLPKRNSLIGISYDDVANVTWPYEPDLSLLREGR